MKSKAHQYTIRHVSPAVHRALLKKAEAQGVSLNTLVLEALKTEAGLGAEPTVHDDLDDLFGSWVHDKAVDDALSEQRRIHPRDWE